MKFQKIGKNIVVTELECFSLGTSVDCGQAFRWAPLSDNAWHGVVRSHAVTVSQSGDILTFFDTTESDFCEIWAPYFDFERDYAELCKRFSSDESLAAAVKAYPGIRILRQEPWEALCSFIISQNNNIPRIKGIISRLCENFGEKIGEDYSFPSAERIAALTPEELAPLRAGFRAKYIIDAARKTAFGEVNFAEIEKQPEDYGRAELQKILGVGAKVAECTLLYGFGKLDAFPVDVWVRRIMSEIYPEGLPECTDSYRGIAQQYLFHWRRNLDS